MDHAVHGSLDALLITDLNILVWLLISTCCRKRRFRRVTNFEKLRKFQPRNFNLNFVARYKAFAVFDIVYIIYSLQPVT